MKILEIEINISLNTDGSSLWSNRIAKIHHNKMELRVPVSCDKKEQNSFGELKVYFDPKKWNISKHGLIYTDNLWIKEFKEYLAANGFSNKSVKDLYYSEQGMQGKNYVSLDCEKAFINKCYKLTQDSD